MKTTAKDPGLQLPSLGAGFYLCMAAGVLVFVGCIVLVPTAIAALMVYVGMHNFAYLGVFFVFFVVPLLAIWTAVKFQEQRRRKQKP